MQHTLLRLAMTCLLLSACTPTVTVPAPDTPQAPAATESQTGAPLGEAVAVFTFVTGDVTVDGAAATVLAPVGAGSQVRAAASGSATLVCANDRVIRLSEGDEIVVTGENCAAGLPLPVHSSSRVAALGEPFGANADSIDLEEDAREREADYGNIPVILSPRQTALLAGTPEIRWIEVPSSVEYLLSLSGPAAFDMVTLEAGATLCAEDPRFAFNRVCSAPWPGEWSMQPGRSYFLTVSARQGLADPLRESAKSKLTLLKADEAQKVEDEAAAITALGLDPLTGDLLLAGLYAERGLYAQAIPHYEAVLAAQPAAAVATALGDSYQAIDLQRYAFAAYQDALRLLDALGNDDAVRAAAEFGMGRVEYSRGNYPAAEPHFVAALDLFTATGAQAAAQAAQKALEETRKRL